MKFTSRWWQGALSQLRVRALFIFDPLAHLCLWGFIGIGLACFFTTRHIIHYLDATHSFYPVVMSWMLVDPDNSKLFDLFQNNVDDTIFALLKSLLYSFLYFGTWRLLKKRTRADVAGNDTKFVLIATVLVFAFELIGLPVTGRSMCSLSAVAHPLVSPEIRFWGAVLSLSRTSIIYPFVEEIEFRGLMFGLLSHRSIWFRTFFTSVMFVYAHLVNKTGSLLPEPDWFQGDLGWAVTFNWLPGGFLLAYARQVSGGIALPFVIHALFNLSFDILGMALLISAIC